MDNESTGVMMRVVEHEGKRSVQMKLDDVLIHLDATAAFEIGAKLIGCAFEALLHDKGLEQIKHGNVANIDELREKYLPREM